MRIGFLMIANLSDTLNIPQSIIATRNEVLEKMPDTAKRFPKAFILGIQFARGNKAEAIKAGYDGGLQGEPDIISQAYQLYAPALTGVWWSLFGGFRLLLDEGKG